MQQTLGILGVELGTIALDMRMKYTASINSQKTLARFWRQTLITRKITHVILGLALVSASLFCVAATSVNRQDSTMITGASALENSVCPNVDGKWYATVGEANADGYQKSTDGTCKVCTGATPNFDGTNCAATCSPGATWSGASCASACVPPKTWSLMAGSCVCPAGMVNGANGACAIAAPGPRDVVPGVCGSEIVFFDMPYGMKVTATKPCPANSEGNITFKVYNQVNSFSDHNFIRTQLNYARYGDGPSPLWYSEMSLVGVPMPGAPGFFAPVKSISMPLVTLGTYTGSIVQCGEACWQVGFSNLEGFMLNNGFEFFFARGINTAPFYANPAMPPYRDNCNIVVGVEQNYVLDRAEALASRGCNFWDPCSAPPTNFLVGAIFGSYIDPGISGPYSFGGIGRLINVCR